MPKPKGEYRNLAIMDNTLQYSDVQVYSFEVKTKAGWQKISNVAAANRADAEVFAQNTADKWRSKNA